MLCPGQLAVLVLLMGVSPQAQPKPDRTTVRIEAVGDRVVVGVIAVSAIEIDCDLGRYAINVQRIKEIRFMPGEKEFVVGQEGTHVPDAVIATTTGEEFRGTVYLPQADVETGLGKLRLRPNKLKKISFGDGK